MANLPIKPYLTLPGNHHLIGVDFHHGTAEQPLSNRQFLEGFSVASQVEIDARVKLGGKNMLTEALQLEGATLGLSLSLHCPSTRFRITSECELGEARQQSLKVVAPPGMISKEITLSLKLTLEKSSPRPTKLCAKNIGSVLWEDSIRIQLEGTGATFPTQEHEFRPDEGGEYAGWRFDFSNASLRGRASRLRLLVNKRNKNFLKGVLENPAKAGNSEALRLFRYAVACALVDFCAANHEEFEQAGHSFKDEGSLGHHLVNFLKTHIRHGNVALPIGSYLKTYHTDIEYREKIRAILQSNIQDESLT